MRVFEKALQMGGYIQIGAATYSDGVLALTKGVPELDGFVS